MGGFFSYDNAFFRTVDRIINVFCISFLWLIFSIPIFTIGASTTAMYYTVNKVLRHGRSYVFKEFWGAFKSNFKQATVIWLILAAIAVIMGIDARIMKINFYDQGQSFGKLYIFFLVMLLFETLWAMYVFPNLARFENSTKAILKNAALMALANLPSTLLMAVILAAYILLLYFFGFMIIFVPAAFMWSWSYFLEKIFRKYMTEEDLEEEDERNRDFYN